MGCPPHGVHTLHVLVCFLYRLPGSTRNTCVKADAPKDRKRAQAREKRKKILAKGE
jgi:hypothetical protein